MTYFFPFIPYYGAIIVVFKVVNDNSPMAGRIIYVQYEKKNAITAMILTSEVL